jgi:tetratricopeptide (TPR) repeat protein
VATALNNLANLYAKLGQYTEAEPLYQRCLRIREASLGKDHPLFALSLNNLALLYAEQNRLTDALPVLDRSRQISRRHGSQILPVLSEGEQAAFLSVISSPTGARLR